MENTIAAEHPIAIFGYGSLINPRSIAKTLGRTVPGEALFVSRLHGYRRVWDVVDEVLDPQLSRKRAIFLNLRRDAAASVVGVSFHVNADELVRLDVRERNYNRTDVTASLKPAFPGTVFTYIAKPEHLVADQEGWVLSAYEQIIDDGLAFWGPDFAKAFAETTLPHQFARFAGNYTFAKRESYPE